MLQARSYLFSSSWDLSIAIWALGAPGAEARTRRVSRVAGFTCALRSLSWRAASSRRADPGLKPADQLARLRARATSSSATSAALRPAARAARRSLLLTRAGHLCRHSLVLGADDGTVTEWDVTAAQRTRCYAPHAAAVTALALTAEGGGGGGGGGDAAVVTASHDGTLSVWAWQPEVEQTAVVRRLASSTELSSTVAMGTRGGGGALALEERAPPASSPSAPYPAPAEADDGPFSGSPYTAVGGGGQAYSAPPPPLATAAAAAAAPAPGMRTVYQGGWEGTYDGGEGADGFPGALPQQSQGAREGADDDDEDAAPPPHFYGTTGVGAGPTCGGATGGDGGTGGGASAPACGGAAETAFGGAVEPPTAGAGDDAPDSPRHDDIPDDWWRHTQPAATARPKSLLEQLVAGPTTEDDQARQYDRTVARPDGQ